MVNAGRRHTRGNQIGVGGAVNGYNPRLIDLFAVLRPAPAIAGGEPPEDLSWQDRALCPETDPEAFFPGKGEPAGPAKRVCQSCEVRAECLEYARRHGIRFGIWGGLTYEQRRRLDRQQASPPVPQSREKAAAA